MTVPLGHSLQPRLTAQMGGAVLERRIYRERVMVGLDKELDRDLGGGNGGDVCKEAEGR